MKLDLKAKLADPKNRILFLCCSGIAFSWIPWFNYSAVLPILKEEFSLTSAEAGKIMGGFQLGYVLTVLITGVIADKIGKKPILVISSLITGVASIAFALFAKDYFSALILRVLIGMGCGGVYAPGLALLSSWFSPRARGMAFGAYTGSSVFSYALGYFLTAPIAAVGGWQKGILFTSYPVFIAVLFFGLVKEPLTSDSSRIEDSPLMSVKNIQLVPLILITIAYMAHMWEQFAFWGWVGPYLSAAGVTHGMGKEEALTIGGLIASITIMMGVFSPFIGGKISDKLGRTFTAAFFSILSAICSFIFGWLIIKPFNTIVVASLIYGFFVVADSAIYKAGLSEMVPSTFLTSALAIQSAAGFGAAIISPGIFGIILDFTNTSSSIQIPWGWAFVSLGIGSLISPICLSILRSHPHSTAMTSGKR
jgi:MFS family permease